MRIQMNGMCEGQVWAQCVQIGEVFNCARTGSFQIIVRISRVGAHMGCDTNMCILGEMRRFAP